MKLHADINEVLALPRLYYPSSVVFRFGEDGRLVSVHHFKLLPNLHISSLPRHPAIFIVNAEELRGDTGEVVVRNIDARNLLLMQCALNDVLERYGNLLVK